MFKFDKEAVLPLRGILVLLVGARIENYANVDGFWVKHRRVDWLVTAVIRLTRYHVTYKKDMKLNPERYSSDALERRISDAGERARFKAYDAAYVAGCRASCQAELQEHESLYLQNGLCFEKLHVELYRGFIAQLDMSLMTGNGQGACVFPGSVNSNFA